MSVEHFSLHCSFILALKLQLLNGAYNGIGRSLGSIIGGKLQAQFGTAKTFLYGAIANAGFATLLALYCIVYQGKQEKLSKKEK